MKFEVGQLRWIESYLTGRTQRVCIQGTSFNDVPLLYGVPQCSVLGPLLFILYIAELEQIINSHGLLAYSYANDNHISFFCSPEEAERLKAKVINSVEEILRWMLSNRLKVNQTKTEFLWAVTSRRKQLIPREAIRLNGVDIAPSRRVKLLGVHIDDDFSLSTKISKTVSSDFFYLQKIRSIRRCLPTDAAKSLVNASRGWTTVMVYMLTFNSAR